MAKQLSYINIDQFSSGVSGGLALSGHKVRYVVTDTVDTELRKGGELTMDDIVDTDTVATWWGKVKQQVKDAEGIT